MKNMKLLIAVPCYNEENRLPLEDYVQFILKNEVVFCFINDGSTDGTLKLLQALQQKFPLKVHVANSKENLGKSNALFFGYQQMKSQSFTHFAYLDADLATPIEELIRMTGYLNEEVTFVFGSRVNRIGSNIKRRIHRHLIGRFFATINSILLQIPVYDTQCGAKVFSAELSGVAFSNPFATNWIFDVEIFFRILKYKPGKNINDYAKEIPLEKWEDVGDSSIKPRHYPGILADLFKIYKIYK